MSSSSNIPAGLYDKEVVGNNIYLSMKHPNMLKKDRVVIAMAHQPSELDLTRPWTAADEAASGFTHVNDQQHVYMRCKVGNQTIDHTHMKFVSAAQNIASGHLPDLIEIQKYLLEKSWKKEALALQDNEKEYLKSRGSTFDLTFSTEPGNKLGCIHVSKVAKTNTAAHNDCVQRLIRVMTAILNEHLAGEVALEHRQIRWAVNASITAGNEDNQWLSHIQLNVTELQQGLPASLKRAGHAYFDKNDEPSLWSVLLFLSHLPDNYHPGILAVYSTRVCCPCETYGAVVFTGTHPHSGSGKGPLPSNYSKPPKPAHLLNIPPLPAHLPYTRLHAVGYPRNNNIEARERQVNDELDQPSALGAFGTAQNWAEWKMRRYIKQNIEVITPDPLYWCDRFAYYDNFGIIQTPRLFIAELCIQHADVAWLDHPEHTKLHNAILAAGVGKKLPRDENAPPKKPKNRQKKAPGGPPITKVQCDAMTSRGKQCKRMFTPKLDGNTKCGKHTEKKTSSDEVSDIERNPVAAGSSSEMKRTFDERDAFEGLIDPSLEEKYEDDEDEGGFTWFDETPGLREWYSGTQYRGYGEDQPAAPAPAPAPQGPVGNVDVSGIYD